MSITGSAAAKKILRGKISGCELFYMDAYELAVLHGFKGTIKEWLESIKGEPGAKGEDGKAPVRGEDYWTEEDKKKILEEANAGKVLYTQQDLTAAQKTHGRANIGAPAAEEVAALQRKFVGEKILLEDGKTGDCYVAGITKGKMEISRYDPATGEWGETTTLLTRSDKAQILEEGNAGKVLYTQQDLTGEQRAQARANIGVKEAVLEMLVDLGIAPVLLDENGAVLTDGNDAILINK